MPTVNGKLTLPDLTKRNQASVRFFLVDQFGARLTRAWKTATDETIVCDQQAALDGTGAYTIVLPDNAALNPANSRWRREITYLQDVIIDDLVVPTGGGPYQEEDIAQNISPLPTPTPSNEVASFSLGSTTSDIAVTGFTLVMVPTFIVTIGDLTRPVMFSGAITVQHQTVASALLMAAITTAGDTNIGNAKGTAQGYGGAAASPTTLPFVGRIPAHTPGSYQVAVNGASGNLRVVGGTNGISNLEAIAL